MRALLLLMAFVATPFAVGVSQGKTSRAQSDEANCGKHLNAADPAGRQVPAHGGIHGVMDWPCESGGGEAPPPSGNGVLGGKVYQIVDGRPSGGLSGWTVTLSGAVSKSAVTDQFGMYQFGSLPAGSYTVCVLVQDGWVQYSPRTSADCPNGWGHDVPLAEGGEELFTNFAIAVLQ